MLPFFDGLRLVTPVSVVFRMLMAVVCGGAVGLERSYKNRPAGFRTHILICIAATIASVTGLYMYLNLHYPTDMSRLGAQVVSGLSFLGAGTIIVTKKNTIKGLTTAAGMWTTGIVGLAIGAGFYEGAIIATILILLAETWFVKITRKISRITYINFEIQYETREALDEVMRYCKDKHLAINNLQVIHNEQNEEQNVFVARIFTSAVEKVKRHDILLRIRTIKGIRAVEELEE
jgi:putative Mg2+ transporter-C (MgtC) family protein